MSERSGVDVENERVEWMWTISEDFICICKTFFLEIHSYVFLFSIDNIET